MSTEAFPFNNFTPVFSICSPGERRYQPSDSGSLSVLGKSRSGPHGSGQGVVFQRPRPATGSISMVNSFTSVLLVQPTLVEGAGEGPSFTSELFLCWELSGPTRGSKAASIY